MNEQAFLLIAATGVPALILGLWHGSRWSQEHPNKLGFKWGFFFVYNTLINNLLVCGFLFWSAIKNSSDDLGALALGLLTASLIVGVFALRRNFWALVLSTILSLNPLWMFINIIYLKNRWTEFKTENSFSLGLAKQFGGLPRDVRLALFVAVAWALCVPTYVFIFDPYRGYMSDDDMQHFTGVMLLPILVGLGLFFFYRRFVR